MAEIRIKGVAKRFGATTALHSVDLTIADREFLVLLGASGCGKTTLLRIVAGLETASEGEVWIGDRRVDHLPPRARGIAMVFQNYAVFPHLTVFENIAFGLRMKRLPQPDIDRRPQALSGGQQQRVALGRAVVARRQVLLMDEPLSNLDALLRLEMRAELKGVLAESKTTTIYVTHDQVEAMSLADRIAVMNGGRIVQAAPPVEVYANPAARFVGAFIGNPPMNFLPADAEGPGQWRVAGVSMPGPASGPKRLHFAVRPEDLQPAEMGLPAEVRVVEPLGPHTLITAEVAGAMLRAVIDNGREVRPGDRIRLAPHPDRVRWFDPETEKAVS